MIRIFEMYGDGMSPRAIGEQLNAEGMPSPGSSWDRSKRRRSGWAMSGIAGDPKRGTGILNNELYIGRVIWTRCRSLRSASDLSERRCVQNPESVWIIHEDERLRIVSQELWDRVKARQRMQSETIGERVRRGLPERSARHTGRGPKYLFSTLLKCGTCGTNYTLRGKTHYACGRHVDGRACSQTTGVKRKVMERSLLRGMRDELLSDEAVETAIKAAHHVLKEQTNEPTADEGQIKKLRAEVDNLAEAIASGALSSSPAFAKRLSTPKTNWPRFRAQEIGPRPRRLRLSRASPMNTEHG